MPARSIAACILMLVCGGAAAFNRHFLGGCVWTRHAHSHCARLHDPPHPHCRTRTARCPHRRARKAELAPRVSSYQDDNVFYGDLSAAAVPTPEPAPAAPTAERDDGAGARNFSALGLDPALQRACDLQGWPGPTAIQTSVIPPLLAGRDVWAEAETGSGKTAAFALPLIQLLSSQASEPRRASGRSVLALVLSPTRELVLQTARRVLAPLARSVETRDLAGLRVCAIYGGVPIEPQLEDLKEGVDVLVATPGRLLDVVMREETLGGGGGGKSVAWLSLQEVKVVILDEADRLLAPAFAKEMNELLQHLHLQSDVDKRSMVPQPASRDLQLCLFSATFPYKTRAAARRLFRGRAPVLIGPSSLEVQENDSVPEDGGRGRYAGGAVAGAVQQKGILVDTRDRTMLLRHLAETQNWKTILVFVASQHATEHVAKKLAAKGLRVAALHGGMTQEARLSRLLAFDSGSLQLLVATDVAARGLDVRGLSAVVNYVGRTGRAGQEGEAVSFITCDNAAHFSLIEKRLGAGAAVPRVVVTGFEPKDVPSPTPAGGGRLGRGGGDGGFVEGLVQGVRHSPLGLAHDRMHGGVKGRKKSKKDKLREAAAAAAAAATTTQRQGEGNVH